MGLLRYGVFIAVAAALLSNGAEPAEPSKDGLSASGLFLAAYGAIADMGSFCTRQPQTCRTASLALRSAGSLLRQGIEHFGSPAPLALNAEVAASGRPAQPADPMVTGSSGRLVAEAPARRSASTLRIDDLIPAWNGPGSERRR